MEGRKGPTCDRNPHPNRAGFSISETTFSDRPYKQKPIQQVEDEKQNKQDQFRRATLKEIALYSRTLALDEIDELIASAIEIARKRAIPFDDVWLGITNRGRQCAVHLFALNDGVNCMIDIHPMSRGVTQADHFLAEGIRFPWALLRDLT